VYYETFARVSECEFFWKGVDNLRRTRDRCGTEGTVGKQSFGRYKKRWENLIKMDPRGVGCEDGRLAELSQDRIQWWFSVLGLLKLLVLIPGRESVIQCMLGAP